jgi:hypothetical protein
MMYLAKVARDYAGIPGSSVPSARVFSRAGDLITNKRNRLAPESADSIYVSPVLARLARGHGG